MSTDYPYRTRRTIKPGMMDCQRDIPRELLIEILEDAHWAPTHGLTQPWRFDVFTGESRTILSDALLSIYDRITPPAEVRPEKRAKLKDGYLHAPVSIAITALVESGGKVTRLDEICATASAVQNLLLSSHQRGVGSFWATPPAACSEEFVRWLGLDAKHLSLGIIVLGYPKEGYAPKSTRVPLDDRVTFHYE